MIDRRFFGITLVLALAFAGCEDPTDVQTNIITGDVTLHDELAHPLPDADQVTVRLLDADESVLGEVLTGADGSFEFEVEDGGPFTLIFAKAGFGTFWMYDVVGGPETVKAELFARSTAEVRAVEAHADSCGDIDCLRLTMDVAHFFLEGPTRRLFRVFLSTDVGVSWAGYESTLLLVVPEDQPGLEVFTDLSPVSARATVVTP